MSVVQHVGERCSFDMAAYERRSREGPCFVCAVASGRPEYRAEHELIYEEAEVLVVLNRYPTLRGYTLVCPRQHVEQVVAELSEEAYLGLQRWVYRVRLALQRVVPTERLSILSLGSQQGNRHVHWHIAPLPPGVAFADQQLAALQMSRGILAISTQEMADLAAQIRARLLEHSRGG